MKYAYTAALMSFVLATGSLADDCAKSCNSAFDACEAVPGADFVACAKKHANCLGFDPYTATKFDTPTACAKGPTKPTGAAVPDECCKKCTAEHEACKGAPGADKAACEKKYSDCLGYNPFQGTWVQPTTCAKGSTNPGVNGDIAPVVVAGGSNLKPALAVLALGAAALF